MGVSTQYMGYSLTGLVHFCTFVIACRFQSPIRFLILHWAFGPALELTLCSRPMTLDLEFYPFRRWHWMVTTWHFWVRCQPILNCIPVGVWQWRVWPLATGSKLLLAPLIIESQPE